jgi:hypothetical protein
MAVVLKPLFERLHSLRQIQPQSPDQKPSITSALSKYWFKRTLDRFEFAG